MTHPMRMPQMVGSSKFTLARRCMVGEGMEGRGKRQRRRMRDSGGSCHAERSEASGNEVRSQPPIERGLDVRSQILRCAQDDNFGGLNAGLDFLGGGHRLTGRMLVLIDNYDSFTYNLVQKLGEVGGPSLEM